jgi:hypothetical protein
MQYDLVWNRQVDNAFIGGVFKLRWVKSTIEGTG